MVDDLSQSAAVNEYWESRKNSVYYQVARILTEQLGVGRRSLIDVGSAGCPYLDWFQSIPERTSLDLNEPYRAEGTVAIKADFLAWEPDRRYDLVTCMQVLEHVPDATGFARKLLSTGDVVIVSVPYKWRAGQCKDHVHDPVDELKMRTWFGRDPNFSYLCREVHAPVERLIQVYESGVSKWRGTNARAKLLAKGSDALALDGKNSDRPELGPNPIGRGSQPSAAKGKSENRKAWEILAKQLFRR